MRIIKDPRSRIEGCANPDDCWLLCDECRRFFQYANAKPSPFYPQDACPFSDCDGLGIGFRIYLWDDLREPGDARWPSSTTELDHGTRAPEMEPFYEEQFRLRREHILSAFAASAHAARLEGPPRYLDTFFRMMADLCWDLTDTECDLGFGEDLTEVVYELPVWAQQANPPEAERMHAELRAFFDFAAESDSIVDAPVWAGFWQSRDWHAERFAETMATDNRLSKQRSVLN